MQTTVRDSKLDGMLINPERRIPRLLERLAKIPGIHIYQTIKHIHMMYNIYDILFRLRMMIIWNNCINKSWVKSKKLLTNQNQLIINKQLIKQNHNIIKMHLINMETIQIKSTTIMNNHKCWNNQINTIIISNQLMMSNYIKKYLNSYIFIV